MSRHMLTNRPLHPMAEAVTGSFRSGRIGRREFLASLAALGVSAAGARALGGLAVTPAAAQEPEYEPPGVRLVSSGLRDFDGSPPPSVTVTVLPRMIAPPWRRK